MAVFKQFISEKEIADVKKKRQEEWEKVRKPDQPLEVQEVVQRQDGRSLYEQLKVQKDQADAEKAEQFKFKNMIYKGLDDEESQFLNLVSKQQAEQHAQKLKEEKEELFHYQQAVEKMAADQFTTTTPATGSAVAIAGGRSRSSLLNKSSLVRVKRKSSGSSKQEEDTAKKPRIEGDSCPTNPAPAGDTSSLLCGYPSSSDSD